MSVESIALALHHSRSRNATTRLVLVGIANHDGDGGAWPSVSTLAKYACCSPRQVSRAIAELVALGELAVDVNGGGNRETPNNRRPNRYRVILACPADCDRTAQHRTPVDNSMSWDDTGVTPETLWDDTTGSYGMTPMSSKPSLEPSLSGESPQTSPLRATAPPVDNSTSPQDARCSLHVGVVDPPPCRPCGRARIAAEDAAVQAETAAATARRAQLIRAAAERSRIRSQAIAACTMCDDRGYRNGALCSHDPDAAARTAAGVAAARGVLYAARPDHTPESFANDPDPAVNTDQE